jgi:D-alanine-D-alanine ligase
MTQKRKTIGLLFGGRSAEHGVSKLSAANIFRALAPDRYDVVLIGIGHDGRWLLCDCHNGAGRGTRSLEIPEDAPQVALLPGGGGEAMILSMDPKLWEAAGMPSEALMDILIGHAVALHGRRNTLALAHR